MFLSSTHYFPSLPFPHPSFIIISSFYCPSMTTQFSLPPFLPLPYLLFIICILPCIPPSDLLCFSSLYLNFLVTPPYKNSLFPFFQASLQYVHPIFLIIPSPHFPLPLCYFLFFQPPLLLSPQLPLLASLSVIYLPSMSPPFYVPPHISL